MKEAIDFLEEGELDGRWDEVCHEMDHPWYEAGTYDGRDTILKHSLKISFYEGIRFETGYGMKEIKDYFGKCEKENLPPSKEGLDGFVNSVRAGKL